MKRLFVRLMKPIYKTMRLCRTSSPGLLCTLLIIITVRGMLIQTDLVQPPSFRYRFRAICCEFGEFRKCRCFVLMFCFDSLYKLAILYIWKKYRQKTCNVDLLNCSNSYFSKIFGCFYLPGSQAYSPLYYI